MDAAAADVIETFFFSAVDQQFRFLFGGFEKYGMRPLDNNAVHSFFHAFYLT